MVARRIFEPCVLRGAGGGHAEVAPVGSVVLFPEPVCSFGEVP